MKEFTAIYSTEILSNVQYSFRSENREGAVRFAASYFATSVQPSLIIVENFEGSKANEGVIIWANGALIL